MPTCAHCTKKPCRRQDSDAYPGNCPSRGTTTEGVLSIYSEDDIRILQEAARVEQYEYGRCTRVEETMHFAYRMGYRKLGLAFCVGFSAEAIILTRILRSNGFDTETVCCKNCGVAKESIGLTDAEKLNPGQFEAMCNPGMQAKLLDEAGTDLNIIMGLCVGHDTMFIRHSQAPVTVLGVKDRSLGHNPLAALYTADSYMKRQYDFIERLKAEEEQR